MYRIFLTPLYGKIFPPVSSDLSISALRSCNLLYKIYSIESYQSGDYMKTKKIKIGKGWNYYDTDTVQWARKYPNKSEGYRKTCLNS